MTLKTFHFAGVAGMSITEGVPRIKEIINASKVISTPIITCQLLDKRNDGRAGSKQDEIAARVVKGRIEKTYVKDVSRLFINSSFLANHTIQIVKYLNVRWTGHLSTIALKVDKKTIEMLQLEIEPVDVANAIIRQKKLKIKKTDVRMRGSTVFVDLEPVAPGKGAKTRGKEIHEHFQRVNFLSRVLPNVVVSGHQDASRAVITVDKEKGNSILVEGYGLRACMNTAGVDGLRTSTNSVMEMRDVLGIEAARTTIIKEIQSVMRDMDIDPRHMQLLADVMTYKGEVLGITRFGLSKMRDSVLQLASFEKTPDHLFEAAWHMKTDKIEGVSECIIMGQTMSVGTGAFKVVQRLNLSEKDLQKKPTPFEDAFRELRPRG